MRLAFFGTPEVAAATLRALVGAGHEVTLVVTRPDARRGRGRQLSPSPVKAVAAELGLAVGHDPREAPGSGAELGVVVAYGRVIKPEVLAALPMVNVHFSLLPRWRGAAPVERAVLAGDAETGVCIMQLDEGLDTGPVYGCEKVLIGEDETVPELRRRLGELGTRLLLRMLAEGFPPPSPQTGEPTYAAKLEPSELQLDFAQPAYVCLRTVRLGRAWTTWRGRRLIVLRARLATGTSGPPDSTARRELKPGELSGRFVGTGEGLLELVELQPEGKAAMAAEDWLRGARPRPGERLGA